MLHIAHSAIFLNSHSSHSVLSIGYKFEYCTPQRILTQHEHQYMLPWFGCMRLCHRNCCFPVKPHLHMWDKKEDYFLSSLPLCVDCNNSESRSLHSPNNNNDYKAKSLLLAEVNHTLHSQYKWMQTSWESETEQCEHDKSSNQNEFNWKREEKMCSLGNVSLHLTSSETDDELNKYLPTQYWNGLNYCERVGMYAS